MYIWYSHPYNIFLRRYHTVLHIAQNYLSFRGHHSHRIFYSLLQDMGLSLFWHICNQVRFWHTNTSGMANTWVTCSMSSYRTRIVLKTHLTHRNRDSAEVDCNRLQRFSIIGIFCSRYWVQYFKACYRKLRNNFFLSVIG